MEKFRGIKQTRELAKNLARGMSARIYALVGDLGSGKTTFVQAFLKALGVKGRITSPTFVLIKKYELKHPRHCEPRAFSRERSVAGSNLSVYHIDVYRLHKPKELLDLGFKKIIADPENVVLIEWADKIKRLIPKGAVWIKFEHGKKVRERIIKTELKFK